MPEVMEHGTTNLLFSESTSMTITQKIDSLWRQLTDSHFSDNEARQEIAVLMDHLDTQVFRLTTGATLVRTERGIKAVHPILATNARKRGQSMKYTGAEKQSAAS